MPRDGRASGAAGAATVRRFLRWPATCAISASPDSTSPLRHQRNRAPRASALPSGTIARGLRSLVGGLCLMGGVPLIGTVASAGPFDPARDFAAHCFSPFLTEDTAHRRLSAPGVRVDFYDLRPFSDAAVSPVTGRPATPGTDRRCEVAFEGGDPKAAAQAAADGLAREGILAEAALPDTHSAARGPGTVLLAARYLNPNRIAVVHVGSRPGPNGVETFLSVERLEPGVGVE